MPSLHQTKTVVRPITGVLVALSLMFATLIGTATAAQAAPVELNQAPSKTISGPSTQLNGPTALSTMPNGSLAVTNINTSTVGVYNASGSGSVSPSQLIAGPATMLDPSYGVSAFSDNRLIVSKSSAPQLLTFAAGATGSTAPTSMLTTTNAPLGGVLVLSTGEIAVTSVNGGTVSIYPAAASGSTPPSRVLSSGLSSPVGLAETPTGELVVADMGSSLISVFAANASTGAAPVRTIDTSPAGINPVHTAVFSNGDIAVTDFGNNAVAIWPSGASGAAAPKYVLRGGLTGLNGPSGIAVLSATSFVVANTDSNTLSFFELPGSPSVPSAPTGVTASSPSRGVVNASWTASSDGGSPITGYEVKLLDSMTSTVVDTANIAATPTSHQFTGVGSGNYQVSVSARNAQGLSPTSTSRSVSVQGPSIPEPPGNVVATSPASGVFQVAWDAAVDNGSPITGYTIVLFEGPSVVGGGSTAPGTRTWSTSGLSAGTYTAQVQANNSMGASTYASSNAVTISSSVSAPDAPTALVGTVGSGQATITFTAPASDGGAPITNYEYQLDGGTWVSTGATASPITITGLTNGTTYQVALRAINSAGPGAASTAVAVTPGVPGSVNNPLPLSFGPAASPVVTPLNNAGLPLMPVPARGNNYQAVVYTYTAVANGGLRVENSACSQDSYGAVYDGVPLPNNSNLVTLNDDDGPGTCFDLNWSAVAGKTYYILAMPFSSGFISLTGTLSSLILEPASAPTNLSSTPADGYGLISFTPPASTGGGVITGYEYQLDGGTWTNADSTTSPIPVTNLTNGQTYSVKLRAVTAAGAGAESSPLTLTPQQLPGSLASPIPLSFGPVASPVVTPFNNAGLPPMPVPARGNNNYQAVVYTYTAVANGGLRVENSACSRDSYGAVYDGVPLQNNSNLVTANDDGGPDNCFDMSWNATAGKTYYILAMPYSSGYQAMTGTLSSTIAAISAPGAPTSLVATPGDGLASVAFSAPASDGGAPITDYEYQLDGGSWVSTGATASPITITGLTNGTTYQVALRAINSAGPGAASSSVSVVPVGGPGVPQSVAGVSGAPRGLTVSWVAPVSDGGSPVTGYVVSVTDGVSTLVQSVAAGTLGYSFSGLDAGTWQISVVAVNALGSSGPGVGTAVAVAGTVPGAPTGVVASAAGPRAAGVSWSAPVDSGGVPVVSYEVTLTDGTNTYVVSVAAPGMTAAFSNVVPGSYTATVVAVNSVGDSAASTPSAAVVVAADVPGVPTSVAGVSTARGELTASWVAPVDDGGSALVSYQVRVSDPVTGVTVVQTVAVPTTTFTFAGLAGGSYSVEVAATNAVGTSGWATAASPVVVAPVTVPGAPTGVTATSPSRGVVDVAWVAPVDNGGDAVTEYEVTLSDGTNVITSRVMAPGTTARIPGVATGSWSVTVKAKNAKGLSTPSSPAVVVNVVATTVPDPVTGVSAVSPGARAVNVSWTPPVDDGGSAITGYVVSLSSTAGTQTVTVPAGQTTASFTGLDAGSWTASVVATNALGSSTPAAAPAVTVAGTAPTAPTSVAAVSNTPRELTVSWAPPVDSGGTPITAYQLTVGGSTVTVGAALRTHTFTGLAAGSYSASVTASNSVGAGPAATTAAVSVAGTVPTAATSVAAVSNAARELTVSWAPPVDDGGSPITIYRVTVGGSTVTMGAALRTYTFTGLAAGSYSATVTASNIYGAGPATMTAAVNVAGTVPTAATSVVAVSNTPRELTVSWAPPVDSGGTPITAYQVTVGGSTVTVGAASRTHTFTGLAAGSYSASVTASNAVGAGPAAMTAAVTVAGTVPSAATSVAAVSNSPRELTVTWAAPVDDGGSPVTGYQVSVGGSTVTVGAALRSHTFTGLAAGSYSASVTASNAVGAGPAATAAAVNVAGTVPTAATSVVAVSNTPRELAVTWAPPANDGGSPITGYQVSVGGSTVTVGAASRTHTFTDLAAGSYSASVTASNAVGAGPVATAAAVNVAGTVPTAATSVAAVSNGPRALTVSWAAPVDDGGSPITGYRVELNNGTVVDLPAGASSYTFTGLSTGSYQVTVTPSNAIGAGPAVATPMVAVPGTVPSAPQNVVAVSNEPRALTVTWTAPDDLGGAPLLGYRISIPGQAPVEVAAGTLTYTFTRYKCRQLCR